MDWWKNESSLSLRLSCLTDSLSLRVSVSVSVSYSVLLSISSFIWVSGCSFCLLTDIGSQVGRWINSKQWLGNLNAKTNSLLIDISQVFLYGYEFHFLQSTLETVTLLVLYTPFCSYCEGHLLSPSGSCECLKVLIFQIQQSIQQAFVLERFVPLVLCNKIVHSTKGYMPHFIDFFQKYFHSWKSGKIKTKPEKYVQL